MWLKQVAAQHCPCQSSCTLQLKLSSASKESPKAHSLALLSFTNSLRHRRKFRLNSQDCPFTMFFKGLEATWVSLFASRCSCWQVSRSTAMITQSSRRFTQQSVLKARTKIREGIRTRVLTRINYFLTMNSNRLIAKQKMSRSYKKLFWSASLSATAIGELTLSSDSTSLIAVAAGWISSAKTGFKKMLRASLMLRPIS